MRNYTINISKDSVDSCFQISVPLVECHKPFVGLIKYLNGIDGKPAISCYDNNGKLVHELWFQIGKQHRIDDPAVITYYDTGEVESKMWFENDVPHRINAPAYVKFSKSGEVIFEADYIEGKLIRN